MRVRFLWFLALILGAPLVSAAQAARLNLPSFASLDKKATQFVDITLDTPMLGLAGRFMSDDTPDEAALKSLLTGLHGIYVRSYQFADTNAYSKADVDSVRSQLSAPGWMRVVSAHDRKGGNDVDIYLLQVGSRMEGMAIIAAEPRGLTIVNIVGSIDLEKLRRLEGRFGVPKLNWGDAAAAHDGPASPAAPK